MKSLIKPISISIIDNNQSTMRRKYQSRKKRKAMKSHKNGFINSSNNNDQGQNLNHDEICNSNEVIIDSSTAWEQPPGVNLLIVQMTQNRLLELIANRLLELIAGDCGENNTDVKQLNARSEEANGLVNAEIGDVNALCLQSSRVMLTAVYQKVFNLSLISRR